MGVGATLLAPATTRAPARVADAMVTEVKRSRAGVTVRELRELFRDEHVHVAVLVERGVVVTVVDRADVETAGGDDLAVALGTTRGRTVAPDTDLERAREWLLATGRRRLVVVGPGGELLGLLCLKRTRLGFCSDGDVRARARRPHDH